MDEGEDLNPNCHFDDPDGPSAEKFGAAYELPLAAGLTSPKPTTPDIKLQRLAFTPDLQLVDVSGDDSHFVYNSNHPDRGVCLIVSNDKFSREVNMPVRVGSQADISNVYRAFHHLDFECLLVQNITARQLRRVMTSMASRDHSRADCFACVILSHGEEGHIYATDGLVRFDDLVAPFKGDACPSLVGKPKLFFVQACRGNNLDDGTVINNADPDLDSDSANGVGRQERTQRIPSEADFLVAYSVVPGYYSWRNSRSGSWFIQAIANVFLKEGRNLDLMRLLTRVSRKVAYEFESNASSALMSKKKQIPSVVSMLTKELYFPPKKAN